MLSDFFKSIAENLEDYIDTFLKIYKAADQSDLVRKELNDLQVQLDKENRKREKLLELYMDETISKDEFTSRNSKATEKIESIESEIAYIRSKSEDDEQYAKSIRRIGDYFENMYDPDDECMTKQQVDEMAKAVIERIDVVPINERSMKLQIRLMTGDSKPLTYLKKGARANRHSAVISKKMIDAYKQQGHN
jgi:chromosome segregation ATPase